MKIFITHGRNSSAKANLIRILKSLRKEGIEWTDFDKSKRPGDGIFEVFERASIQVDVAIVLATPDDVGALAGSTAHQPRARENVWIELGYFWALLGRERTLLLCQEGTNIPSNYHGVIVFYYKIIPSEMSDSIKEYLRKTQKSRESARELLFVSADPAQRDEQWRDLHRSFRRNIIISGAAMGSVRNAVPFIFNRMENDDQLTIDFVLVNPNYVSENTFVFESAFGANFKNSNRGFCREVSHHLRDFPGAETRVTVHLIDKVPFFAAVVSDGPDNGSEMLVQPFAYKPRHSSFDHMRVKLRRRSDEGAYMVYWNSLVSYMAESTVKLSGMEAIRAFADSLEAP